MKINDILKDKKRIRKIIDSLISITEFVDSNIGKVLCPFHNDSVPSSKIYNDSDGIDRLFCFSCNKAFTSYDYIKDILGIDTTQYLLSRFDKDKIIMENRYIVFEDRKNDNIEKINKAFEISKGDFKRFIDLLYIEV